MAKSRKKYSSSDLAHFWIPFSVLAILSIIIILTKIDEGTIKWLYVSVIFVLFVLQAGNEIWQYFDKDRDSKYGGRKGFLENSKKDWTLFLLALFIGSILFFLLVVI